MKSLTMEFLDQVWHRAYDFKSKFQKRLAKITLKAIKHKKLDLAERISAKDSFVNSLFEAAIIAAKI